MRCGLRFAQCAQTTSSFPEISVAWTAASVRSAAARFEPIGMRREDAQRSVKRFSEMEGSEGVVCLHVMGRLMTGKGEIELHGCRVHLH